MSGFVPYLALMASAGSGKTFSLVARYLSLLFMGENPEEIVALTFTNKAANEMQNRLIDTLTDLETREELGEIVAVCAVSAEVILQRRPEVLSLLLSADTKVMTIDSFFSKILRKFSLHAGIMPNFSTFESQHELKVLSRFLRLCEIEGKEDTLVRMAQITSKRVSDLIALLDELYARASQLSHLTFEVVALAPFEMRAMELHASLLACFEHKALSVRAAKALQAENFDALLKCTWLGKPTMEYWDFKKHFDPGMDDLLHRLQQTLQGYMQAKEQTFFAHLFTLLELYKSAKLGVARELGELSFDDITVLVHYLLQERIDRAFLYFRLDSRISHMLLDEFQDTSVLQFEILRPLVEEIVSGSGTREHRSFFLVGDTKQSIYRFRGGSQALLGTVIDRYGLAVDSLRTNWRSSRSVVDFVNRTFRDRIQGYAPQQIKPGAALGYVSVVEDAEPLLAMRLSVETLLDAGALPGQIAVLTATNKDGAAVEEALMSLGIDVVTETTSKLVSQPRVRALIAYLHYCYFGEAVYARQFFALSDLAPTDLPRFAEANDVPAAAVRALIAHFGLFEGDLNLVRFLELLERYNDLEAFMFDVERIDAKAVSQERTGIRVLTVHKSKGLEFPYVIVLDRLGKKRADSAPIITRYAGTALTGIYLRQSRRAEIDAAYAEVLDAEAQLAADDVCNALYVALTRAREQLYVIAKPGDSVFEALKLQPMEQGDPTIEARQALPTAANAAIPYTALSLGRQSDALHRPQAVQSDDPYARSFGTALHYALEMLPEFKENAVDTAMIAVSNRFGAQLDAPSLVSIQERIVRLVRHHAFQVLVDAECLKEQPLLYGGELRYLDLLVRHADHWVVIDYKSSRRFEQTHREQVAFYIKAVEGITKMPVVGYLCYLLEAQIDLVKV